MQIYALFWINAVFCSLIMHLFAVNLYLLMLYYDWRHKTANGSKFAYLLYITKGNENSMA